MNNNLRIIETARSEEAINEATKKGFRPLVKPVVPSNEIGIKYAVLQNQTTGEIEVINDYRADKEDDNIVKVIDFQFYYPYHFKLPYAAYLIPKDLKVGEQVWLSDLIEDVVGRRWNQGDTYRLEGCEATWNGTDFVLEYKPITIRTLIG